MLADENADGCLVVLFDSRTIACHVAKNRQKIHMKKKIEVKSSLILTK